MIRLNVKRLGNGVMLHGNIGTRFFAAAVTPRDLAWVFDTSGHGSGIVRLGPLAMWTWPARHAGSR